MEPSTIAWLSVVLCGFIFGLSSGPTALVRIGIALMLLSGLGVLLANTSGYPRLAYWFVIGMMAIVVAFLVALVGALIGAAVRKAFRQAAFSKAARTSRPSSITDIA